MNNEEVKLEAKTASLSNDPGCIEDGFVKGWTSTEMSILWDVNFVSPGRVDIAIGMANDANNYGSGITVNIGYNSVTGQTIFSGGWTTIAIMPIGSVTIPNPGTCTISVHASNIRGTYAGDLAYVLLTGPGTRGATEIPIQSNADSVHLWWEGGDECQTFYNSVQVVDTFPGTYFMVCGFTGGYFGIQDNDFSGKRTVHFSIWDTDGGHPIDHCCVAEEERVVVVDRGEGVQVSRFGNEGTGAKSSFPYYWEVGRVYHFVVRVVKFYEALQYSAYFYLEEAKQWKRLAVFKVKHNNPRYLTGLYSFVEDFFGCHGRYPRKAIFGPAWFQRENGRFEEMTLTTFTQSGPLTNTNAGLTDGKVYLATGGRIVQTIPVGQSVRSAETLKLPEVLAAFQVD